MIKIKPFRAFRPKRNLVHLVVSRDLKSYKKNTLKVKLKTNPYSFLHIINQNTPLKNSNSSKERFQLVRKHFLQFFKKGIFIQDKEKHLYLYKQTTKNKSFTGIIAAASLKQYEQGIIKKHEETLLKRENLFKKYLNIVNINAEPILLIHPSLNSIKQIYQRYLTSRAEYEFTTTDKITHKFWVINSKDTDLLTKEFKKIDSCYIADGHHRIASSYALYKENQQTENKKHVLSYFLDEEQVEILEYNRAIKSLNNLSETSFINQLNQWFKVKPLKKRSKPKKKGEFTLCLKGKWFYLKFKKEKNKQTDIISQLDTHILSNYLLKPILKIKNIKSDQNLRFVNGKTPLSKIEKNCLKGSYELIIINYPLSLQQLKQIADNKLIMPPKSTWIEPKLRSGLTLYNLNE